MSSIWIPRSCLVGSAFLIRSLSLMPNLHSGIPLSWALTSTWPTTSDLRTVPLIESSTFTFSTISIKTSFLLYRMPSARQEIAPVAWIVICFSFSMFYARLKQNELHSSLGLPISLELCTSWVGRGPEFEDSQSPWPHPRARRLERNSFGPTLLRIPH